MEDVIAANALAVRETLGWSRDRLAKASGVTIAAVYLLERLGWDGSSDDQQLLAALHLGAQQRLAATATLARLALEGEPSDDQLGPSCGDSLPNSRSLPLFDAQNGLASPA